MLPLNAHYEHKFSKATHCFASLEGIYLGKSVPFLFFHRKFPEANPSPQNYF